MLKNVSAKNALYHDGYKIQLALCIERQPIRYSDLLHQSKFRIFRENWAIRTGNSLSLFKPNPTDQLLPINSILEDSVDSESISLDNLLEQERSFINKLSAKVDTPSAVDNACVNFSDIDNTNLKNLNRFLDERLYLIIKYNISSNWTFPIIDYDPQFTLRKTLLNLCNKKFLHDFSIYFLGYSPICHIKTKDFHNNKLSKIFYFRARLLPGTNLQINPEINDYAWVTKSELSKSLDIIQYKRVFQSLPLSWSDINHDRH